MNKQGILIVVSGFSGAGKGTLMKGLMSRYDQFALSVSATTRKPREGEEEGKSYFFKTKEEFESMIKADELIEYACYVGNYYGTPKAYVEEQMALGKDVILEIEIQGAMNIRKQYPDALLMFVTTKDADTLKNRLVGRGTESLDVVEKRLSRAVEESEGIEVYDYLVVNDDLDTCVEEVYNIVQSHKRRIVYNEKFISQIRNELKKFSKGE